MMIGSVTIQSNFKLPLTAGTFINFNVWCEGQNQQIVNDCLAATMPIRFTDSAQISSMRIDQTYHKFSIGSNVFPSAENLINFVALLKERLAIDVHIYWTDLTGSVYQEIA